MTESILKGFEVWTDAKGVKSRGRVKSIDNISHEGIYRLRGLILEMAIQGKLTSQDKILENSQADITDVINAKNALIEEGKIKKEKPLTEIADEEILFKIPNNWSWIKLGIIGVTNIGLTYSPNDVSNDGLVVLRSGNIQNGEIDLADLVRVNKQVDEKVLVEKGDLLICARNGSRQLVGKCALIKSLNEPMSFGAFMAIFRCKFNDYIKLFIESPSYRKNLEGVSTTTINQITQDNLRNTVIPIPPYEEQKRIVTKVNELMALCDKLEEQQTSSLTTHQHLVKSLLETLTNAANADESQAAWEKLSEHFDTLFCTEDSIEQLKQAILQLAIMGRLVKQDSNDEPASEFLARIKKEKIRLIDSGEIKKTKETERIADGEKPFNLPGAWNWCRLEELCMIITKGSSPKWQGISYTDNINDVLFITSENVGSYELLLDNKKYVEPEFNKIGPKSILKKGDYLMNIVGGSIGRTAVFNLNETANINQAVCLIRTIDGFMNSDYLLHFFNSQICISYMFDKQVDNARANLSMGNISKFLIPIPPRIEQDKIVDRINLLFSICDTLRVRIVKSQNIQRTLAQSVVDTIN